jgi:hypothetical protein
MSQMMRSASSTPGPADAFGLPEHFGDLPPNLEALRADIMNMRWQLEMEQSPDALEAASSADEDDRMSAPRNYSSSPAAGLPPRAPLGKGFLSSLGSNLAANSSSNSSSGWGAAGKDTPSSPRTVVPIHAATPVVLTPIDYAWAHGFAAICLMQVLAPHMSGANRTMLAGLAILLHWSGRNADPLL